MDRKKLIPLFTMFFLFILACLLKLFIKDGKFSMQFILGILEGKKSSLFIFYNMRLPSIIASICCAFLVIISTYILQTISKNDLADPSALGYNNVAITVLALLFLYIPATNNLTFSQILILSAIVVFGFSIFMYNFSKTSANNIDGNILLLVGIGVNALFQMILTYIKTYTNSSKFEILTILMQGNFDHLELLNAIRLLFLTILVIFLFLINFETIRILQLGNIIPHSLGVNIKRKTLYLFLIMSLGISVSIMFGGSFAFIGFTSLHIMRHYYNINFKLHFFTSVLCAATIIIFSDLVAHQLFGIILPTNIFLGIFGGIGFLIILLQRRSNQWQSK